MCSVDVVWVVPLVVAGDVGVGFVGVRGCGRARRSQTGLSCWPFLVSLSWAMWVFVVVGAIAGRWSGCPAGRGR